MAVRGVTLNLGRDEEMAPGVEQRNYARCQTFLQNSPDATDLRAYRREKGLRPGEFGELLGRREAIDRRRQHGVRIGAAIGRAVKLRQSQRSAQFEAPRFLRLRDSDRGL